MPRMKFSTNAIVGGVIAVSMMFGTLGVAAAHSTAAPAHKGVHLVIWDFFNQTPVNTPERVALNKVAQKWAKATHNTVTEPAQPAAGANTAFINDAKAGKAADVILVPDDQAGVDYGDKIIAQSTLDKKAYVSSAVSACTIAGKTWCYPWALEEVGLYYNKKIVPASLFKGSPTWTKVASWSASYAKKNPGKYGIDWQWDNFYYDYDFLTAFGGGGLEHTSKGYNGHKVIIDNAATIKGLNYLKKFVKDTKTPVNAFIGTAGNNYGTTFATQQAAIVLDGPWSDATWKTAKPPVDYAFAPLPSFGGHHYGQAFLGVQTMVVNKYSKHVKAAKSLAAYLSLHGELPLFHASGRIPAGKAQLKSVSGNPELKQYAKAFKHSIPLPNVPQMGAVWTPGQNAIALTLQGHGSAASNLKAAGTAIRKAIKTMK